MGLTSCVRLNAFRRRYGEFRAKRLRMRPRSRARPRSRDPARGPGAGLPPLLRHGRTCPGPRPRGTVRRHPVSERGGWPPTGSASPWLSSLLVPRRPGRGGRPRSVCSRAGARLSHRRRGSRHRVQCRRAGVLTQPAPAPRWLRGGLPKSNLPCPRRAVVQSRSLDILNRKVEYRFAMPSRLDQAFAALSDPTRRAIVSRLARRPARVTDVAGRFPMSLNAVSKHLKVLEGPGLIKRRREGREHHLELRSAPLREIARWTLRYERFWNEKLDALEAFLEEED